MPAQISRAERRARRRPGRARPIAGLGRIIAVDVAAGMSAPTRAEDRLFDANRPLEVADQGAFSIPGRYVEVDKQTVMVGQMYVQYQIPKNRTRPYPVVMIHGGGQTGVEFPRHAGRTPRLGRRLRRQRLCRLRRRSVGTRPFGIFRRQLRQDAQALGRERGAALHRPGAQAALAAGRACTPNGPERGRRAMRRSTPSTPARSRPSATRR